MSSEASSASVAAAGPSPSGTGKTPLVVIVVGMAGTGKTTLVHRLQHYSVQQGIASYFINLDPALTCDPPYDVNIDIRDTVNYREVIQQYRLGPNGGIMTTLNLYATKFHQVISILEKKVATEHLDLIVLDTPGQIEVFTWSASGQLITEALASTFPTVILFAADTTRCISPQTFMSTMLYSSSIMFKTQLPLLIAFNKIDVADCATVISWMKDADALADAVRGSKSYSATLTQSLSLFVHEFYETLVTVGVSAVTGAGMDALYEGLLTAKKQYETEFLPCIRERAARREEDDKKRIERQVKALKLDKKATGGADIIPVEVMQRQPSPSPSTPHGGVVGGLHATHHHRRRNVASNAPAAFAPQAAGAVAATATGNASQRTAFFEAMTQIDRDPVFAQCLTTSHPDSVLRRIGILRQEGVYKGHHVYFNPKNCLWQRVDDDKVVMPPAFPYHVDDRFDISPKGVIQIFGDDGILTDGVAVLSNSDNGISAVATGPGSSQPASPHGAQGATDFVAGGAAGNSVNKAAGLLDLAAHERNLRMMAEYHNNVVNPSEDALDGTGEVRLDPAHQRSYIRQYLSRAIPYAAQSVRAAIVLTNGSSAVAEQVGVGLSGLQKLSRTHVSAATNEVDAVAVSAFRAEVPPLRPGITHHVVLRRSMVSRMPTDASMPVNNCRGWMSLPTHGDEEDAADAAAENDDDFVECVFCGQLKEWHAPYSVCREHRLSLKRDNEAAQHAAAADTETNPAGVSTAHLPRSESVDQGKNQVQHVVPLIAEEPSAQELDQYVGRLVDQLAVGCRQELVIPGRLSSSDARRFESLFSTKALQTVPDRPQIPVVVILIGGEHHSARRYLAKCIARRYTILVVEGSGGYADYLGSIKRRILKAFPFAGRDGVSRYSTALDPLTSEILSNYDLVKFIRRGAKNEELIREIDGALKGEGVLAEVWRMYAKIHANAKHQSRLFFATNLVLMFLSLLVTFLTALQTYLLLQIVKVGDAIPPTFPDSADERGSAFLWQWTLMQWSIILLPIMISATQAYGSKADYGAKWIALRTTAHRLLSEIYQYRTSCLLYYEGEVERHKAMHSHVDEDGPGGNGGAGGTGQLVYKSKEDLLQKRAMELDAQTREGACKQLTLFDKVPSVPPKNILEVDDGFSALTPDQYVRVRLRRMVEVFERDAHHFTNLVRWCQNGITLANGVGTALAAMAAFTDGTIQAWLAFTTALVATLLRALEGFRLDFQVRKKVQSSRMLQSIGAWWGSMREKADNSQNRDWLVEQVETVILEEVDSWAQQFGQALETMRRGNRGGGGGGDSDGGSGDENGKHKRGGGDDDDGSDRDTGGDGSGRNTFKSLELTELSAHSLGKALSDPAAPQKLKDQTIAKIRNLKQKLLEQSGAVPMTSKARREAELTRIREKAKKDNQDLQDGRTRRGDAVSIMDQVQFTTLADADMLPQVLHTLIVTKSLRFVDGLPGGALSPFERPGERVPTRRLSANSQRRVGQEELAHAKNISFFESLEALRHFPDIAPHLDTLPHRHILELCKRMVCENLLDEVKTRLPRARLRELCGKTTCTEEVVSQLLSIALTPRIENFSMSAVLMLIRDITFRNNLALLPDCEVFFGELVAACIDVFNPDAVNFALFNRYCAMIAELDVDLLMHDVECCVALARGVENLVRYGIRPWVLQKGDLLDIFPDHVRSVMNSRSHVQLAAYLDEVLASKPSLTSVGHLLRKYGRELFPESLFEFLSARRENQILFASIAESLTQSDILLKPMNHLVRMMDRSNTVRTIGLTAPNGGGGDPNGNAKGDDAAVNRELHDRIQRLPPANLRLALSILQTIHSNAFGASIVDRACDSIVDFSLREVLNYENVVRLVAKLSELKVVFLERCPTKAHVLQLFGFDRLVEALDNLSDAQLKEIFFAFQYANATDWTILQAGVTLRTIMEEEISKLELVPMQRISKRKRPGSNASRGGTLPDRDANDDDGEPGGRESPAQNVYDEVWVREMLTWTGKTVLRLVWASGVSSADRLTDEGNGGDDGERDPDVPLTARTIHRRLEETLLDAPDYPVMKALKPFHPAMAREILRRLQPLGVEADVSRLFGVVIGQGGYNRKQLERMEMALSGWEVRQALVDSLGTMLVDDSFDMFEATPDAFVDKLESTAMKIERCFAVSDCDHPLPSGRRKDPAAHSVVKPPLREAFSHLRSIVPKDPTVKEARTLQDAFTNILTELRHSSPLLVFYRLAALCHFVDIRELFSTVEIRTDLVTLLTLIILDEGVLFNAADADITRKALAVSSIAESSPDELREASMEPVPSIRPADDVDDEFTFGLFSHKIFSDFSTIDCRLMGLGSGHDTDILPKGYWHKRLLTAVHLRYEQSSGDAATTASANGGAVYEYEEVISILHELSEPSLRYLMECHAKVLQSTIGRFFQKLVVYKRHGGRERLLFPILEDLPLRQSFIFDIAMSNLVRSIKVFPHEMSVSLDHLEVDKFSSRSESDRRAVLGVWMSAGSQGPLDVLIKASTVPAEFTQDPLAQTLRKKLQQPGAATAVKDPSMAMFHDSSCGGRFEELRMRRKFMKYVFDMIDFAKPDDEKNALEQSSYIYESRLSQIMSGHKSLRAVTTAHAFVTTLKQSVAERLQRPLTLPPRRQGEVRQQGSVYFDARSDEETTAAHPREPSLLPGQEQHGEYQQGAGDDDTEELGIEGPPGGSSESMPSAASSGVSPAKSRSSGGPRIRRLRAHAQTVVEEAPTTLRDVEEVVPAPQPLPGYSPVALLPHPMTATYSLSALTAPGDDDTADVEGMEDAVEIGLE